MHKRTAFPHPSRRLALVVVVLCLLLLSGAALAASGPNVFTLTWWTADGGGTTGLQAGSYSLGASAGQPEAASTLTSGNYSLSPGFWSVSSQTMRLYLPLVIR